MTIKQLFYICLVFSVVRIALWIALPLLLVQTELEPFDLGIISGLVNMFFVFFLMWLIFKIFMISELKEYLKFVIPLVVLIIVSFYGRQLSDWVFENFMNTDQFKKEAVVKSKDLSELEMNKVYPFPNEIDEHFSSNKHKATGKVYQIFIHNETQYSIDANESLRIQPNEGYLFKIPDTMGIALSNGIQFFFGEEEGLEVADKYLQVTGLGGQWLDSLKVPKSADWAFSILYAGEGDPIPQ